MTDSGMTGVSPRPDHEAVPRAGFAVEDISQRFGRRFHRDYARWKLNLDPVYDAVTLALRSSPAPLLDIGCGIGILAHYLRERDITIPFLGVDFDADKIAAASQASAMLSDITFALADVRHGWPAHQGSVTLLDVLQYASPTDRTALLKQAAACTTHDGRLLIRTGIRDDSWRFRFTWLVDRLANMATWMKSEPHEFPSRDEIISAVEREGLKLLSAEPLQGKLPFNNFFFVFQRA